LRRVHFLRVARGESGCDTSGITRRQYVLRKLPHITALFWVLKILATTLSETVAVAAESPHRRPQRPNGKVVTVAAS